MNNEPLSTIPFKNKLRQLLIRHEGYRLHPYTDTVGKITIGIGRNLTDQGLSDLEVSNLFQNDVNYFHKELWTNFFWYRELETDRQIALIDLCFMGFKRFCEFKDMIDCLSKGDMTGAAAALLDSKYAEEVHQRAEDIATILDKGVITL